MQKSTQKKKSSDFDSKLAILILQTLTVIAVLLFGLGIRIFGGQTYKKLSAEYHERFDDITTVDEVLDNKNDDVSVPSVEDNNKNSETQSEVTDENNDEAEKTNSSDEFVDASVEGYLDEDDVSGAVTVSKGVNTMIWPVSGKVTSEYGYRVHPITSVYSMHGGIDISAETGTNIKSVYDGKISATGYSNSYGYYVIITHSDNMQTLYAHCSKIISAKGDSVKKGDTVALVGSTGRSTGAHLHFEIRIGGCRINPRWLLSEVAEV